MRGPGARFDGIAVFVSVLRRTPEVSLATAPVPQRRSRKYRAALQGQTIEAPLPLAEGLARLGRSGIAHCIRTALSASIILVTLGLGSAAEVISAHSVCTAATKGKRIGRNACASHHYGGNDDRDSVQHKFLHGSFPSS
jgi:hypothetical protein